MEIIAAVAAGIVGIWTAWQEIRHKKHDRINNFIYNHVMSKEDRTEYHEIHNNQKPKL